MAVLSRAWPRAQPKSRPATRLGPVALVAALAIVIIALLQLFQTSEATTTGFAIQGLEQEKLELETAVGQLEAEVAALSALSRIQREAERLGLAPPEAQESLEVNVAWPAGASPLPARFAPVQIGEAEVEDGGSAWWQKLVEFLPFR